MKIMQDFLSEAGYLSLNGLIGDHSHQNLDMTKLKPN